MDTNHPSEPSKAESSQAVKTNIPPAPLITIPIEPKKAQLPPVPNLPPVPTVEEKPAVFPVRNNQPVEVPMPPIPPQKTAVPCPLPAIPPAIKIKSPQWWRLGWIPALTLIMAAAIGDLLSFTNNGIGMAAGIACVLLTQAFNLLRKDLTTGEICFISGLGLIGGVACVASGSGWAVVSCILLPLFIIMLPSSEAEAPEPNVRYRNWWSYWTTRHTAKKSKDSNKKVEKTRFGTYILCALVCLAIFVVFIRIFAAGNPVVDLVWTSIVNAWKQAMEYLNLCWEHLTHAIFWVLGILAFGVYTIRRPSLSATAPAAKPLRVTPEYSFPFISFSILLGLNLAFLVVTSTDIAFLWLHNIPEGISHTEYLYEGAASITTASVLASIVLLLLFLPGSMAKRSGAARFLAYLLILQTLLLAASVYLRLYNLIEAMGFTLRRIAAAEVMVLGIIGIIILLLYIACCKNFRRYVKICMGTAVLLIVAQSIVPPSRMVGELNMHYYESHPHWKFTASDFKFTSNRKHIEENLPFALFIYRMDPSPWFASQLTTVAEELIYCKGNEDRTWHNNNLRLQQDLRAAEEILNDASIAEEAERANQYEEQRGSYFIR